MKLMLALIFFSSSLLLWAQSPIDVTESTLKISGMGEEVFYFGFAAGDKLIFNFEEVNGKELKELEIIELPSSSKFMDYKTKKVQNKIIDIQRAGIYQFRLANSAIVGRICKFKIQRIPASEATHNFNTSVYWKTEYDTTYTPERERYLQKSDTVISHVLDQVSKVSSQTAINGNPNRTLAEFILPPGTVSWSYYMGVGSEGKAAYEASKDKFATQAATAASTIPGYGTMAALAIYGINTFGKVQGRDNVKYWFISDPANAQLFLSGNSFMQFKQGDVVNDAAQMKTPLEGKVFLGLYNDNIMDPIEVIIKVTAVQINQVWGTRMVNKINVASRKVAYLNN